MPREVHRSAWAARSIREAIASCRAGRFEEAIAALEPLARRKDAAGRQARRYLGQAHKQAGLQALCAGSPEEAEPHLRRAEALLASPADVQDAILELHALRRRFDLCAEEAQRCLRGRPLDAALWRRLAQALWREGRRAEAYSAIEAALRQAGDRAELHVQRGLFLAAEDRLSEARESFARAAEADGESAEAHHYLGLADAATGRHREAVEGLQRWAELRPGEALPTYQLALAARAARRAGSAVPVHPGHLCPGPVPAGTEAVPAELVEAALKGLEGRRPGELSPEDRGQAEAVLRRLVTALAKDPGRGDLHGYCAEALEALGREAEAIPHAETAAGREPSPRTLVRLGRLLAKVGRREEAVERLEQAVRQGADWADVHCMLAESLGALGRSPAAQAHLARALEQNPGLRQAQDLRTRLAA